MVKRLPPLKPLPAFEAAARTLSFTQAAEELNVTQAAISHQIKALEEALGAPLFRRLNRALRLTEEGEAFLIPVRRALEGLADAAERVRQPQKAGALTVSVLPSFASTWLVPRLARFRQREPEIDIRLSADYELADFDRDDIDAAIRWGKGDYPGLSAERFMTEELFPVCSPALATEGPHPLKTPADLKHHTLLHDDVLTDWRVWLLAAGVDDVDPSRGPSFNYSDLVLQAAIAGQGVALGRSSLAHDALARGQLVRPFDVSLPGDYAYYFVCPDYAVDRPRVKAFRDWLFEEAERDRPEDARAPILRPGETTPA
ncbi:MAG: transcriptional regulator GcvA [Alphaproteobacteria bacterium]|nr:transcriptional regulator GcvA [Alphaproteobacteria bacterium]